MRVIEDHRAATGSYNGCMSRDRSTPVFTGHADERTAE